MLKGSQGTWEILWSPPEKNSGMDLPLDEGPGRAERSARHRTERIASAGWYRQAKATKRGGRDGRKSEHPIVPPKPGNHPHGTRWREGGAALRNSRRER